MAFLSWRKDYEVGEARLDAEHRCLFQLINEYHDLHDDGMSPREHARVLNRLIAYAEEHFQHEEALMRDAGYPRLESHQTMHSALVTSVFAINERLAADVSGARAEILSFLKRWLVEHVVKSDMDIGDFMRRKARQAAAAERDESKAGERAPAVSESALEGS